MSSGQKSRHPGNFPRMKVRGQRRRLARLFRPIPAAPWVVWRESGSAPVIRETRWIVRGGG